MAGSQIVDYKDTKFYIFATEEGNYFYGNWTCEKCGQGGSSSKKCTTEQQAWFTAQANAETHYNLSHQKV